MQINQSIAVVRTKYRYIQDDQLLKHDLVAHIFFLDHILLGVAHTPVLSIEVAILK